MDLGIKGRRALVTGASRGIGAAIAVSLAREGVNVILVARGREQLAAVRSRLEGQDNRHQIIAVDLTEESGLERLIRAVRELGELDIIVHNLGGVFGRLAAGMEVQRGHRA